MSQTIPDFKYDFTKSGMGLWINQWRDQLRLKEIDNTFVMGFSQKMIDNLECLVEGDKQIRKSLNTQSEILEKHDKMLEAVRNKLKIEPKDYS